MTFEENAMRFDPNHEIRNEVEEGLEVLDEFHKRFPFRRNPETIYSLTPEDVYNPRVSRDYFFYWLEYKLVSLGRMAVGSTLGYRSAKEHLDTFKDLLKNTVDDNRPLAEKVDLEWEKLRGFGNEKIIAKKIISVYYDEVLPIWTTSHLRHFHDAVMGRGTLPRDFDNRTLGQKYAVLMDGLRSKKRSFDITADWSSAYFVKFLYEYYYGQEEPTEQPVVSLDAIRRLGLNDFPRTELDVVFMFSKLHEELGFPFIVKMQTEYPDIQVLDERNNTVRIEAEFRSSHFIDHNHPPEGCDVVVCWESDVGDDWPDHWPQIISLREYLSEE